MLEQESPGIKGSKVTYYKKKLPMNQKSFKEAGTQEGTRMLYSTASDYKFKMASDAQTQVQQLRKNNAPMLRLKGVNKMKVSTAGFDKVRS